MDTHTFTPVGQGHAHDVDLEDTFDFLNTDDTEGGFPVDRLPTLDAALTWFVDRGVIHKEGADRTRAEAAADRTAAERDLARIQAVRSALREVSLSLAANTAPSSGALDTINRALHARQVIELVPDPDGIHVDHRHVGDPVDDALAHLADPLVLELTGGHPGTHQVVRERDLRLDLLRLITDEPPALERHGDLWQPGEGSPASRSGTRGRAG